MCILLCRVTLLHDLCRHKKKQLSYIEKLIVSAIALLIRPIKYVSQNLGLKIDSSPFSRDFLETYGCQKDTSLSLLAPVYLNFLLAV